ncbi:MAG: WD40/YVTN/BNR-like repeat-containing protein, partial [Terriglobales bacterium]
SPSAAAARVALQPRTLGPALAVARVRRLAARAAASPQPAAAPPAILTPLPAQDIEIEPAVDFSPLTTGFEDQLPLRGARAELASWGGATAAQPTAAEKPAAAPLLASNLGAGLSGPMAPASAMGLGWAISRGGQVLRSVGSGLWAAVPLVPGVRFRALASAGNAIWAGGRSDQVYFSPDHGGHWRQVRLPDVGAAPAPLASIAASDDAHVVITDGTGQQWASADGGARWVKH